MTNFNELLEAKTTNVSISVNFNDLMKWGSMLINSTKEETKQAFHRGEEELLLSINEVLEKLHVKSRSTLWRWEQKGYLLPVRAGGKILYRSSDVDRVIK